MKCTIRYRDCECASTFYDNKEINLLLLYMQLLAEVIGDEEKKNVHTYMH